MKKQKFDIVKMFNEVKILHPNPKNILFNGVLNTASVGNYLKEKYTPEQFKFIKEECPETLGYTIDEEGNIDYYTDGKEMPKPKKIIVISKRFIF